MKRYLDPTWLREMYEEKELSQRDIAKLCDVDQSTIHKFLIRFDISTRPFCGRAGKHSPHWKGGRFKTSKGYIHILAPDHPRAMPSRKYVPEQILIAEKHLKRFLTKEEAVHHINEVKDDNRVENLYLFPSEAEHQRYHQKLRKGSGSLITESNL